MDTINTEVQEQEQVPVSISANLGLAKDATTVRREKEAAAAMANPRNDSQRASAPRSRRSNLGGASLTLNVYGTIPGFHLYWENDVNNKIEILLDEGFEFVKPEEVGMTKKTASDTEITDRISKFVGSKEDGTPMRAFLLKCPEDLWKDIQYSVIDLTSERDQHIRAGTVGGVDSTYKPKGFETKVTSGRR